MTDHSVIPPEDRCECGVYRKTECERGCLESKSSVIDHAGNMIVLKTCDCGAQPEYHSAAGLSHEVVCQTCGRQTDMEICGLDAVHEWNAGRTFPSASKAPVRSLFRSTERRCARDEWQARMKARAPLEDRG